MNRELNEALARFLEGTEGYDDRCAVLEAARWAASFPTDEQVEAAIDAVHDATRKPGHSNADTALAVLEAVALGREES
jgi:hypothetical protein